MNFAQRYEKLIEQFGTPGTTGLVPGDFLIDRYLDTPNDGHHTP